MDGLFGELVSGGSAVDLDLALRRNHEPALLDARAGVSAEFGAIIVEAGYADFNDKFDLLGRWLRFQFCTTVVALVVSRKKRSRSSLE